MNSFSHRPRSSQSFLFVRHHATRGVTLVELMVVVSIAAILAAVAVPQYASYVGGRSIDAQISALSSTMRLARSEALKRAIPVTLCPSTDPEAANPQCTPSDADRGWATGWIVFTDLGVRGTIDGSDTIIKVQPGFPGSGGMLPSAGANYTLSFSSNGLTVGALGNRFTIKNKATPKDTRTDRYVCISAQGASRLCP